MIRNKLRELIGTRGQQILYDHNKFTSLMLDLCSGTNTREIKILATALNEKIPQLLLSSGDKALSEEFRAHLSFRLENETGLRADKANWAINIWAEALGMVTGEFSEIKDTEKEGAPSYLKDTNTPSIPMNSTSYAVINIEDHAWHEIRSHEYPDWITDNKFEVMLRKGHIVDDGVFDFRMDTNKGNIEISLKYCFNQHYYDKSRSKPTDIAKKVQFGSIIRDRYWHPMEYNQLYDYLKKPAVILKLKSGYDHVGKIFIYRRNFSHERYEVRVRDDVPIPQEYHRPS